MATNFTATTCSAPAASGRVTFADSIDERVTSFVPRTPRAATSGTVWTLRPSRPANRRHRATSPFGVIMVPVLIAMVMRSFFVSGQNCFGGIETFEKLAMTDFDDKYTPAGVLLHQVDQALTRDCINLCKQQPTCLSFGLDYVRFRCAAYAVNSNSGLRSDLVTSNSTNFFEKICYRGVSRDEYEKVCGVERLWAFERVRGAFLEGFERLQLNNVGSRAECAKACLMESTFVCRSADYDELLRVCRLSKEDRRTQPQAFRQVPGNHREYIENQCASAGPTTCLYETKRDVGVVTMDSLVFAHSPEDCQFKCDKEHTFNCRSFSITDKRCFLSGDDSVSLTHAPLPIKYGSLYGEKKCVTEQCNQGIFTYEKITGYVIRSAITVPIELRATGSLGITGECREACDKSHLSCPAFAINYLTSRCERLDRNTQGRTLDLVPQEGESYFEKVCLRVPEIQTTCQDKFWAFERVIGHEMIPSSYQKTYNFVQSRRDCIEYCLHEKDFVCRSALYNDETTDCKLSNHDRRTLPANYVRNNNHKINYLENQCIRSHSTCPYEETNNAYPTYTDLVERDGVTSQESCQNYCNDNSRFLCRSFAYYSSNGQCFISGDDRSSSGSTALQSRPGMVYFERKCDQTLRELGAATAANSSSGETTLTEDPATVTVGTRGMSDGNGHATNVGSSSVTSSFGHSDRDIQTTSHTNPFSPTTGTGTTATGTTSPFGHSSNGHSNPGHSSTGPAIGGSTNYPGQTPTHGLFSPSTPFSPTTTFGSPQSTFGSPQSTFGSSSFSGDPAMDGRSPSSSGHSSSPGHQMDIGSTRSLSEMTTVRPVATVLSKCGTNSRFTFERIPGFEPIGGYLTLLYSDTSNPGIVGECAARCDNHAHCRAFIVDYNQRSCHGIFENSSVGRFDLRLSLGKDYFEGFCVPTHLVCDKTWQFDRIVDQASVGAHPKQVVRYLSKKECKIRCMEERHFPCLSVSYDGHLQECRLFDVDRHGGVMTLIFTKGTDYMENQCAYDASKCSFLPYERDISMVSVTKSVRGSSTFFCEQECDQEKDFNCRSFTYIDQTTIPGANICLLSADNRKSSQKGSTHYRPRALYGERDCRGGRRGRIQNDGPAVNTMSPFPVVQHPVPWSPSMPHQSSNFPTSATHSPNSPLSNMLTTHPHLHTPPPGVARCNYHQYTFEKTFGYDIRYARKERSRLPPRLGVAVQCQDECLRRGFRCNAFVIEYGPVQSCFFLEDSAGENRRVLTRISDTAYFEKVCLKERNCGKLWTFERVIGHTFEETPDKEVPDMSSRTECTDACLGEKAFDCRSATYDYVSKICRLFQENRRSRPNSFKATMGDQDVDYLENQCAPEPSTCQYRDHSDTFLPFVDRLSHAFSLTDCQRQCDGERLFPCRSVSYETYARDCALSSEDTGTIGSGRSALQERRHSTFSEKGSCEQVTVTCSQQDMLLTINFDSPFSGRVYAKGNPSQCFMVGTGQTQLQFSISLGSKCGTRPEGLKNFANDVVVQQHAVIMTDSDRTIRVLCSFEAADQTVTLSSPNAEKPGIDVHKKSHLFTNDLDSSMLQNSARSRVAVPVASIVSNTAPPPSVVMRIMDRNSHDAQVVGLGDELTLVIELRDPSSAFGIFARNLYARSANGESLFLIDNNGCPTDPVIFPALRLDSRGTKALAATFKAFRFPSTGIVNFEVQVRFCQDKCEAVKCSTGHDSYGRRRRRRETTIPIELESEHENYILASTTQMPQTTTASDLGEDKATLPTSPAPSLPTPEVVTEPIASLNRSALHDVTPTSVSPPMPTPAELFASFENTNATGSEAIYERHMAPYSYPANYQSTYGHQSPGGQYPGHGPPPPPYGGHYGGQPSGHGYYGGNSGYGSNYGQGPSGFGNSNYGPSNNAYAPGQQHPNSWASRTSSEGPPRVNFTFGGTHWASPDGSPGGAHFGGNVQRPHQPPPHYPPREMPPPTVLSGPPPSNDPFATGPSGSNPQVVNSLGSNSPPGQASSPMFTVQSSRPLPAKEKGKFKPPRPLPRPKGNPSGGGTLQTSITVKDKEGEPDETDKGWTIERRPRNPLRQESGSCNTGPAILYTAIVVTLLHCGIISGGYMYYRRFYGYHEAASGGGKLIRPHSFSTDDLAAVTTMSSSSHHAGSGLGLSHGNLHHSSTSNLIHESKTRPSRSNLPPQGSTTSSNNANVFYGHGHNSQSNFRENTNRELPTSAFRSMYNGPFGSPP